MRPIKFRGKSHDNEGKIEGEWIYGFLAAPDQIMVWNEDNATGRMFQVYPETVGQFTGLKDCKRTKKYPEGQEIYKGDIYTCSIEGTQQKHPLVIKDLRSFYESLDTIDSYLRVDEESIEVIGNCFDNPELLGEKTNEKPA